MHYNKHIVHPEIWNAFAQNPAILIMKNDRQKPCQNQPNMAFSSRPKSNFLREIVPARHFFVAFPFEQGAKPLKRSTFLVYLGFLAM